MKRPNFFILGAAKCGTTSMAAWLGEHERIFMSNPKEPQHFNTDIPIPGVKSLPDYLALFNDAGENHLAVGEASVIYLYSRDATRNILNFNPASKFIVMLRSPLEMAPSFHGEMLWLGHEDIDDFETAWRSQKKREPENEPAGPALTKKILVQYRNICLLGEQVKNLLEVVDRESVLFILMEDLRASPHEQYRRALKFLGVPQDGKAEFDSFNVAKRPRSKFLKKLLGRVIQSPLKKYIWLPNTGLVKRLADLNVRPHRAGQMRPEFREELVETFRGDVELLSELLERDLSHWLR